MSLSALLETASDLLQDTPTRYLYPADPSRAHMPRAVIYARQSKKQEDDSSASPFMQRTRGEAHCAAQGFNPVACFSDVGKSGWDAKVIRPGFEEMMTWVRAGKCDVVVIYMLSRLTRQGALDAMNIEAEMRKHGVALVSVREPYLDTSSPVGIGIFAIIAGLAKQESDNKSDFITDARDEARKVGGHLSGPAPFGMKSTSAKSEDGVKFIKLVPEDAEHFPGMTEADVVRAMVAMALAGKSPGRIAEWLNAEGIPSPAHRAQHLGRTFGPTKYETALVPSWVATQVYRVLYDPRIGGMAGDKSGSYTYTLRRDEAGNVLAPHVGIITAAEWFLLQEALSPKGKVSREARKGHQWLLTGWDFFKCFCGVSATCSGESNRARSYRCSRNNEYRKLHNHAGTSVMSDVTDDYVAERVFARMLALDVEDDNDAELLAEVARRFAAATDTTGAARDLAAVKAQLDHTTASIAELYEDKDVHKLYQGREGKAAFARALAALRRTEDECRTLRDELEAAQAQAIVLPVDEWYGDTLGDPIGKGSPWSTWGIIRKREFLALWLDSVTMIAPPSPGARVPIAERLTFQWARPAEDDQEDD